MSPCKLTHQGGGEQLGANGGSSHYKSNSGMRNNIWTYSKQSLSSCLCHIYVLAWRPKVGPKDDDLLSSIASKDSERVINSSLGQRGS